MLYEVFKDITKEIKGIILDVGCGAGRTIKYILESDKHQKFVIGLDIDYNKLLNVLKIFAGDEIVSIIYGSSSSLPLRNFSIDIITNVFVFYELDAKLVDLTLYEISRILKKEWKPRSHR